MVLMLSDLVPLKGKDMTHIAFMMPLRNWENGLGKSPNKHENCYK